MGQDAHTSKAAGLSGALFYSAAQAAVDWHMSEGGLNLARARRDPCLEGAYCVIGRRVHWSKIRPRIVALGLGDPEALGQFCRGAGIRDLRGLLEFLGGVDP